MLESLTGDVAVFRPRDYETEAWDAAITAAYAAGRPLEFRFDLTGLDHGPGLGAIVGIKGVLDKHRPTTRRLLTRSTVVLSDWLLVKVARRVVGFFRPEKPVTFEVSGG